MTALVERDIADQPGVLRRVVGENDAGLAEARRLVAAAGTVRFVALGSSRHAAGYGAEAIEAGGGPAAVVLPAPGWGTTPVRWRDGDVAVAVSQSGLTPALLAEVTRAAAAEVPVIAVVNDDRGPLARRADVTLACGAGPERVVAATKSMTAAALLLRALAGNVPEDLTEALADAAEATLAVDLATATAAGAPPSIVVCDGFAGEWVAQEVALKLAEVAGRHAAAESLVEYLHGPAAAAGGVLAFVTSGDPNAAVLGGDAGTVTVGTGEGATVALPGTGHPDLDALVRVVAGQRVAVAWARATGQDPDAARGLSKVTSTR